MKKYISSLVAILLLSGVAYASESTKGVTFGVSSFDLSNGTTSLNETIKPESGTQYDIGFATTSVSDNNIFMGMDSVITFASLSASQVYGLDANLKIGYQPIKGLSGYAIGSLCIDYLSGDNNEDGFGYGYGYGLGAEYQFAQHFAANIEWKNKTIHMSTNVVDYDYDYKTVGLNLKYLF
jgi:hypothetical protein